MMRPALLRGPTVALSLVLTALAPPLLAAGGDDTDSRARVGEPLRAEEAFVPSLTAEARDALTVSFAIEDGHYLYRDRMSFALVEPGAGVDLGDPAFPDAIIVEDEFFGESATYRDAPAVALPLNGAGAGTSITLDVTWQGCADIGLCYPPTTTRLEASLPTAPPTASLAPPADLPSAAPLGSPVDSALPAALGSSSLRASPASSLGSPSSRSDQVSASPSPYGNPSAPALADLFGGAASGEPELLSPEEAYTAVVTKASPDRIEVLWRIEPDYYLYRDKLGFVLDDDSGAADAPAVATPALDAGVIQHDEFFGDVEIWRDEALAVLPIDPPATPGSRATLAVAWQGCADIGVCFPPKTTLLEVVFDDDGDGALAAAVAEPSSTVGSSPAPGSDIDAAMTTTNASTVPLQSEQGRLAALLGSRGLWINALAFVGFGLLLAFTPCVLPMIPILSSLIVGRGDDMTTGRAFRLSLIYVLVMASAYAALGVIVGLTGYNVQPLLQDPWVLSAIAVLFVLLSLSMFGLFELQLPLALQAKLTNWSNSQKGGEVGGVVVMALLSTLIVGPCMTAPLMGALIYIADTGDAAIGGVALFSLGLGMGIPLLLVGLSAGTLLPRAGVWMERVKQVFGVVLLAMAIYMLSRFLPTHVTMGLAGALALASGVLFGATDTLDADSSGGQRFGKGAGLIVAVYGLALLVGAFAGGGSYTTPLGALAARPGGDGGATGVAAEDHALAFRLVKGPEGLAAAVAEASAAGRPVMLDFYADWCISCKEMEAYTFTDAAVQAALGHALVVQADVTANDAADQALLDQFGLYGPPGIIFYDADGQELPGARVVGYVPAERFAEHVSRAIGERAI